MTAPSRPAILAVLALALLLIPTAVSANGSYSIDIGEREYTEITTKYYHTGAFGDLEFRPVTSIRLSGLQQGVYYRSAVMPTAGGYSKDPDKKKYNTISLSDYEKASATVPVTFMSNDVAYGVGYLSYGAIPDKDNPEWMHVKVNLNFGSFKYTGESDTATFTLVYDQAALNSLKLGIIQTTTYPPDDSEYYAAFFTDYGIHTYLTAYVPPWSQSITFEELSAISDNITVDRNDLKSIVSISSNEGTTYTGSGTTSISQPLDSYTRPYTVEIIRNGKAYEVTLPNDLAPQDPLTPTLYGDVINVYTGEPINGATIVAHQPDAGRTLTLTSTTDGKYSTEDISASIEADHAVTISATAAGYHNATISFQAVPRYTDWYVPILMVPDQAPVPPENKTLIHGYIVTKDANRPIQGATVTLSAGASTTTTSTGYYIFDDLDSDTYTLTATAHNHDALTETVTTNINTATQRDLALTGQYTLKITAKDAETLQTITNATTISLDDDQQADNKNPASFPVDYGSYTITTTAEGYYHTQQYQYVDQVGETQATILLSPKIPPTPAPEYPNYPPHNVRFHCIDDYGLPLPNVTISAEYLETTSPWSWFTDLLGIPSTVNIKETALAGTTGSDGSITFSMIESVRYAITAHDPASNLTVDFTLYPQETQYTIQFRTRPPADAETHPLYDLEAVPLAADTQISLRLAYKDRDNATTSLSFWVMDGAGEYVHTEALTPTYLNWTNASYTVENRPTSYTWGFDANHATRDDISAARTITLHGSGRLVDLGFEDDFWYYLLSAIWIVALGAIFSGSRVRFGAIIIPLIGGGIPTLFGWLPAATAALICILVFIGVFVYMRKSEYKLYR